jgi:hypothetical protein
MPQASNAMVHGISSPLFSACIQTITQNQHELENHAQRWANARMATSRRNPHLRERAQWFPHPERGCQHRQCVLAPANKQPSNKKINTGEWDLNGI